MNDVERARKALENAMAEWEKEQGKTATEKALNGPHEAAMTLQQAMIKEFWQRGKKYC